jgi:hypothetical protein
MKNKITGFLLLFILVCLHAAAQKAFTEGTIVYNVKLESPEHTTFTGVYTFIFKGSDIRKELKLSVGYEDIVLLNDANNKVYSLQNKNGKKYAIELNMPEILSKLEKFKGFVVTSEENNGTKMGGYPAIKAKVTYKDGSVADVFYTKDWYASPITFERFPAARFLPLSFVYKDENGSSMQFDIASVSAGPIATSIFRIPPDYKMISLAEYKQLSK